MAEKGKDRQTGGAAEDLYFLSIRKGGMMPDSFPGSLEHVAGFSVLPPAGGLKKNRRRTVRREDGRFS